MQRVEDKIQAQAIERGVASDTRAGFWAAVLAVISAGLIITSAVFLYATLDQRISLTTIEVFHDWAGLRQLFQETSAYDPRFNLPALEYYTRFDGGGVSLDVMRDLLTRGLLSQAVFANFSALFNLTTGLPLVGAADPQALQQLSSQFFDKYLGTVFFNVQPNLPREVAVSAHNYVDPRLLVRLLRIAGCSFPDAMAGATPVTRSPGCACIAGTYVDFVRATANMTTNVTSAARGAAGDAVLRCMDRRVTWRVWGAGDAWTVHPLAIALYSNGILFLICVAYLLSFYHAALFPEGWDGTMRTRVIQGALVGLTGVLILLLMLHDPLGNFLQMLGLVLSLSTFLFSARSVLDYPSKGADFRSPFVPEPHPLMVCFWLNLPMLIPGPLVGVALAGYNRDVYAVWVVAIVGSVFGIILLRVFWYVWNDDHEFISAVLSPLLFALFDLFVVLLLLLVVYSCDLGVYSMSHPISIALVLTFLCVVGGLLMLEFHVYIQSVERQPRSEPDLNQRFTDGEHASVFVVTAVLLAYFTIVACIDAKRG